VQSLTDTFILLLQNLLEELNIFINLFVVRADSNGHRVTLQAHPGYFSFRLIIELLILIGFPEVLQGLADEDSQIKNMMQRKFFRLTGPFSPCVPPNLGGNIHLSPIVPMGESQWKSLGVGFVGIPTEPERYWEI